MYPSIAHDQSKQIDYIFRLMIQQNFELLKAILLPSSNREKPGWKCLELRNSYHRFFPVIEHRRIQNLQ